MNRRAITLHVNGQRRTATVEPRWLLSDCLREDLGLTGTHVGCEHGVCGACTVVCNGQPVRACLMLAVQADGTEITTVEGLAGVDGTLHPLQRAFMAEHGLQCGFCTPGFLMTLHALTLAGEYPQGDELRAALSGNLCRCTGYAQIVNAADRAFAELQASPPVGCANPGSRQPGGVKGAG